MKASFDIDTEFRVRFHNAFVVFALVISVVQLPLQAVYYQNPGGAVINGFLLTYIVIAWLYMRRARDIDLVFIIYLPAIWIANCYLLFWSPLGLAIIWTLIFPVFMFFLGNERQHMIWSVALLVVNAAWYITDEVFLGYRQVGAVNVMGVISVHSLITFTGILYHARRKKMLQLLAEQYTRHPLTGLENRIVLENELKNAPNSTLFVVNLNRFERLNNLFGHAFGDRLLSHLAIQLNEYCLQNELRLFHLYGDEFAMLGYYVDEARTKSLMDRILTLVGVPFEVEGVAVHLECTIGVSQSKARKFEQADLALHEARRRGLTALVYNPTTELNLEESYARNIQITDAVESAIRDGRLVTYYQPILNTKSGDLEKAEALVRLEKQGGGLILPGEFISILQDTNSTMLHTITRFVLTDSLNRLEEFQNVQLSVNLSFLDIENNEFRENIIRMLAGHSHADRIVFELLEVDDASDYETVHSFIRSVKKFGAKVAIDDFGVGYSNFFRLLTMSLDYLKIDGSIIRGIDTDPRAQRVVSSIVEMAGHSGIKTIAEFVDSQSVLDMVSDLGVDYAQGYHISKPVRRLDTVPL